MSDVPDLQPVVDDCIRSSVVRRATEPQPPLASAIWTCDASTFYQLDAKCQDFVTRYLGRSLITPDDPSMVEVNRKLLRLTFTVRPMNIYVDEKDILDVVRVTGLRICLNIAYSTLS
jgi:hypothetical protein